jgi:hypothetical protein
MDIADHPVPFLPLFQPSDLRACKIPAFCNGLSRSTALEMFARQHNPIRDEGAVALVRVLNAWTAIRRLDLEVCEIGDTGVKALFTAVDVSLTLHRDPSARWVEFLALEGLPEEERGSGPDRIKCPDR